MCTCCFIDLVKQKTGRPLESQRETEIWYIDQLLKAHFDGEIEVYTSTLTVAECTHVGADNITAEIRELFVRLLTSGQYVTLIEPDIFVAEDARDLRWKHDIRLSGADALHIASALSVECKEFLTTDGEKKRRSPLHEADKIVALGMAVIIPSRTGYLSEERRQVSMPGIQPSPAVGPRKRKR
jgi:predicted nucleic acid-binding protein